MKRVWSSLQLAHPFLLMNTNNSEIGTEGDFEIWKKSS